MKDKNRALTQALGHAASDKRLDILRGVGASGSISQAAREAGISYKAAWQAIDTLTTLSGLPLVERTVGGSGGGGARITAHGRQLLALADELVQARDQVLARFAGAGQLAGGLGLRTSMRNQMLCQVVRCRRSASGDPMAWVELRAASGAILTSCITRESADLLGLAPRVQVLVLCKATAVRVLSPEPLKRGAVGVPAGDGPVCQLDGAVERVAAGKGTDEVVLALDGGGYWVGFATHPFACAPGERAVARMNANALVLGLPG